jgi:hypothetical protein
MYLKVLRTFFIIFEGYENINLMISCHYIFNYMIF